MRTIQQPSCPPGMAAIQFFGLQRQVKHKSLEGSFANASSFVFPGRGIATPKPRFRGEGGWPRTRKKLPAPPRSELHSKIVIPGRGIAANPEPMTVQNCGLTSGPKAASDLFTPQSTAKFSQRDCD